jgi:hypothetical protein
MSVEKMINEMTVSTCETRCFLVISRASKYSDSLYENYTQENPRRRIKKAMSIYVGTNKGENLVVTPKKKTDEKTLEARIRQLKSNWNGKTTCFDRNDSERNNSCFKYLVQLRNSDAKSYNKLVTDLKAKGLNDIDLDMSGITGKWDTKCKVFEINLNSFTDLLHTIRGTYLKIRGGDSNDYLNKEFALNAACNVIVKNKVKHLIEEEVGYLIYSYIENANRRRIQQYACNQGALDIMKVFFQEKLPVSQMPTMELFG